MDLVNLLELIRYFVFQFALIYSFFLYTYSDVDNSTYNSAIVFIWICDVLANLKCCFPFIELLINILVYGTVNYVIVNAAHPAFLILLNIEAAYHFADLFIRRRMTVVFGVK